MFNIDLIKKIISFEEKKKKTNEFFRCSQIAKSKMLINLTHYHAPHNYTHNFTANDTHASQGFLICKVGFVRGHGPKNGPTWPFYFQIIWANFSFWGDWF